MAHRTATKAKAKRFKFFREIFSELKKVVWLSKREAAYLTFLVLLVSVSVGIFLGALDFSFTRLVDLLLTGG